MTKKLAYTTLILAGHGRGENDRGHLQSRYGVQARVATRRTEVEDRLVKIELSMVEVVVVGKDNFLCCFGTS